MELGLRKGSPEAVKESDPVDAPRQPANELKSEKASSSIADVIECRSGPQNIKEALREALMSKEFWMISIGFSICGYHVAFIDIHFPAYLQDHNLRQELGGKRGACKGKASCQVYCFS